MKKLLAILLALTLALTLVPTLAFAQNEDGAEPGIVEESKETPTEAPEGETTEEPKEEPQENPGGKTEGETKEEPKEEGKEETKEESEGEIKDTGDVQAAPLLTATENTDAGTPVVLDVNTHVIDKVLQPGNYVLNSGIALSTMDLVIKDNVTIDLNGCSMRLRSLTISSTGSLTLKNSQKGSGGIGNVPLPQGTKGLFLTVYGTFIMDDGVCISDVSVIFYVISMGRAGKLIMNEGSSIKNCKADSGVVEVEGTFIMNGGTITGNTKLDNTPTTAVNGNGRFYQYGGAIYGPVQGAAIEWDDTENAYLIYTAEGLKAFRDIVNGLNGHTANPSVNGKLMNDITLNDGTFDENGNWSNEGTPYQWTPIGTEANPYTGSFDGNGHTIKGLYVKDKESAGLFGYTKYEVDKQIQDVAVTGHVEGTEYAGGIAGYAGLDITRCVNLCRVVVSGSGTTYVGGIAGLTDSGSIYNCTNIGQISGKDSVYAGGITGYANSGAVSYCCNVGKVSVSSGNPQDAGGIAGHTVMVSDCYWLTGTANRAVGESSEDRGTFAMTKAKFADGTVLTQLKGNDPNSPWTKTGYLSAAGMSLPLLNWQQADDHTCNTDGVLGGCTCGLLPEGKGTETAPYEIKTAEDLKAFRDIVNGNNGQTQNAGACAELKADIVLNDGTFDDNGNWSEGDAPEVWTPINGYTGTFDGNGKTVRGLYIIKNGPGQTYIGLFGIVRMGGTVKNVAVTGYVAASDTMPGDAGGIAGNVFGGTIEGCVNLCRVVVGISCAGGIAGIANFSSTIRNCANLGEISGDINNADEAGGVVGALWFDSTMTGCYNAGRVTNGGGIVGNVDANSCRIVNSYYLTGTAEKAAITGDLDNAAAAKSKVEFADGTVLKLLQNGDKNSLWTKTDYLAAAKMTLPLLKWQTADEHTHDGAQWLSDATSHWKECTCGVIYGKDAHSGGTATFKDQAKCSICGQPYGQLASGGIRRQPTGGSGAANTSDTTKTVKSGNTGDAGIALYAGMALLSLTGGAWLRRKKH